MNKTSLSNTEAFPSRWDYFRQQVHEIKKDYLQLKNSPSLLHKSLYVVNMAIFVVTSPFWVPVGYVAAFSSTDYDAEKKGYMQNNLEMRRAPNNFLERLVK